MHCDEKLKDRALAIFLREKLEDVKKFNMFDFQKYTIDNKATIDISNVKKKYLYCFCDSEAYLISILAKYVSYKLNYDIKNMAADEERDMMELIKSNIDLFFEITENEDDNIFIIEIEPPM